MNSYLQIILYVTISYLLLSTVKAQRGGGDDGGNDQCNDISATEFSGEPEQNIVNVNDSTFGIPSGVDVRIRCDCLDSGGRGARPRPVWRYGDGGNVTTTRNEEDPSSPYVENDGHRATLRIRSFSELSPELYICHSRDTTLQFNLIWYDPDDEPRFVVKPMDVDIHIVYGNETAILRCNALGASTYTWQWRDGDIPDKAIRQEGGAILEIPNIRRDEAGNYRCVARNNAGTSINRAAIITVTEELRIVTDPVDISQRIGMTVTLTCSSEGFQSENFTYLWTNSSNYPVYTEASSSGTSSLVFPAVRPIDSGEYRCIVQNEWGQQVTSTPASIQVEIPEKFPPINMPSGMIDQFSVTLSWELSAVDVDLVNTIMIRAQQISLLVFGSGRGRRQIAGNTSTVTITDPNATQYTFNDLQPFSQYCFTITALYAFEGQELGEVAAQPFCTNTSEAVPSAPQDVKVLSQGFTTITLTWTTPQSPNGIILNYTIKYNDQVKVVAANAVDPSVVLSQLPTDTIININVSATNNAGEGDFSNIITTKTLSKSATGNDTKDQLWFQIKLYLDGTQSCYRWVSDEHRRLIASAVVDLIQMECDCVLEQEAIDQEHLLCDQSQLNKTVFRAEITTYQLTRDDLLIILQNMITGGKLMINESIFFALDNSCPVEIASFDDPLCMPPTTGNAGATEAKSDESFPVAAIIGLIIGIITIVALLMIFLLLLALYRRSKKRDQYSTRNATIEEEKTAKEEAGAEVPTMVYSTPLSMTEDPVEKECQVGIDGYLIPVRKKLENSLNVSISGVEFDDDIYFKSVKDNVSCIKEKDNASCINEHSDVKMQPNPSYHRTAIPSNESSYMNT